MIEQILLLIILIIINAFFAATEIAFISLNDLKFKNKAENGDKKAKAIMNLLQKPSSFLATIQIGITLAGFLSAAFASDAFAEYLSPILNDLFPKLTIQTWENISIILITIILSFFMLLFGELVPKRIAMKHDEKIAYFSINIIRVIAIITKPFVFLLTKITNGISKLFGVGEYEDKHITEEEIRLIIDQGKEKGAIKEYEQRLLKNVLKFNDIKINEVLVKKENVFTLNYNLKIKEVLLILKDKQNEYSRIPLCDEENNIVGILYIKDLFKHIFEGNTLIKDIMDKPIKIDNNEYIIAAFNKMKRNKKHLLLVTQNNEYIGIISLEDILEELFGNIEEKYKQ